MGNRVLTAAVLLLIALVGVWACVTPHVEGHRNSGGGISYMYDERTNLCFAQWSTQSLMLVPCDAAVLELSK